MQLILNIKIIELYLRFQNTHKYLNYIKFNLTNSL